MFSVSIYLSLITYAALIVLMVVQICENHKQGEPVAWLIFGIHGFIMILAFIIDSMDGIIDTEFYNIWSNSTHLHGICTLLMIEFTRYRRMRGIHHG